MRREDDKDEEDAEGEESGETRHVRCRVGHSSRRNVDHLVPRAMSQERARPLSSNIKSQLPMPVRGPCSVVLTPSERKRE